MPLDYCEELKKLTGQEQELLHDVVRTLRETRFGSIVLTIHDGKLVEIQKTQRLRAMAMGRDR